MGTTKLLLFTPSGQPLCFFDPSDIVEAKAIALTVGGHLEWVHEMPRTYRVVGGRV